MPYYLDFKYILNESIAEKAQENLKKLNGLNISKDEKKIKDDEKID